ncbi:hypothetical protein [Entomospira culicis]|uniref:Uncharacterized protein n=1 Tax=Entomospira culicis TaxID=2719989 RepID=A0A968KW79_9SPIO|nr:hypothetical protein [Entomospira culicis]NIZ19739.1 hypothetical protein [Entomospira culicis]NIZ69953.1 hypothetical protein [Entomospira culicis]WDI37058.1 hypothetical protein PVA46_06990 [Entomospira culicis]WDI38687.1 hypothetical protein PVA47_07000 [Entomospira culicis]
MELVRDLFVKYFVILFMLVGLLNVLFFYLPFFKKIRDLKQRYNLPTEKNNGTGRSSFFTSEATKELASRNLDFAHELSNLKRRYYINTAMMLIILVPLMIINVLLQS